MLFGWGEVTVDWAPYPLIFHGGSNEMNLAHIWIDTKQDLAIVITTNIGGPKANKALLELARELYTKALRDKKEKGEIVMKQFVLTPAAGKRLIGKGIARHTAIVKALKKGTIVIVAGTTNGYVAEEILKELGQIKAFQRDNFYRGIILPPHRPKTSTGRTYDESKFFGDVVIENGVFQKGKTIFGVVDDLHEGDVILKGANAVDLIQRKAAILIGHPKAGTIGAALPVVVGRRVRLILPVGVEKRVLENLDDLAAKMNAPGAQGPRLLPVPGEIFTELDAIELLTGATASLVAAGGVSGAEGSIWLAVSGKPSQEKAAEALIKSVVNEPAFNF